MLIEGIVSRILERVGASSKISPRITSMGSIAAALAEPSRGERTRSGRRFWGGNQTIANGIAPVQAIPTTSPTLVLWNGESAGGKSYWLDFLNFWLGSGTSAAGATLMVALSTQSVASQAMATGYSVGSGSAGGPTSKARFATGVTFTGSPVWIGFMSTFQLAAANVGQGDNYNFIDGGILIPPGFALGLAILSGAGTTPLYGISAGWDEYAVDTE